MPDDPTDPNKDVNLPKHVQEEIDKTRQHAILIEQIRHDLESNPQYKQFFSAYEPYSVKTFIDEYSWRKAVYLEHGESYIKCEVEDMLRFETEGARHLENILKKKLYNLECKWRAEQITLPEVEQTWDFRYWEHHLQRCPFIPPVTEDEVDACADYILSDQFDDGDIRGWDDIRYLMKSEEDGDLHYPEWYAFYDARFGTTMLHKLPDVRGDKESFYRQLAAEEERSKKGKAEPASPPRQELQRIAYHDMNFIEAFIREFEDKKLLRYFKAVTTHDLRYDDEELDDAVDMLKCADEPVPIEAADNWREAILKAAALFHRRKIAEGLRIAYREYLMRLENGVFLSDDEKDDFMDGLRKNVKKDIIRGRILNGEPPDLNF